MSEHEHVIKNVLINITEDNIEEKLAEHNKEIIKYIKFLGFGAIKIHTRISKPSDREVQILSIIHGR